MTTLTIRNGEAIRLNILPGDSVAVVAVSGTYNASIIQGAGLGAIATAATGATYGPYSTGIIILLTASAASEIDFNIAAAPVVVSDTVSIVATKSAVALADAAATLTAAQMVSSGIFTITPTATRTLTTDTAANIIAALPRNQVGTWFKFAVVNLAAFAVTLAGGTGVTLSGVAAVNNVSGTWHGRIDSATAITIYRT